MPEAKPKKSKAPPAFHQRRHELLAWMREDPRRALNYVAYAWFQCAAFDASTEYAPMAEVLGTLAAVDTKALTERNGPRAWARRQGPTDRAEIRGTRRGALVRRFVAIPRSKAEAGRELVAWIEWWLKEHKVDLGGDGRALVRPVAPGEVASFTEWILWLIVAPNALLAGWGARRGTPDEVERRTVNALARTVKRLRWTRDHVAIAVLVGWGMTRTKARDAVKYA